MCNISRLIAPSSATLNFELLWIDKPVDNEYPYKLGLYSFKIFGIVKYSLQVFSPPIENETPLIEKKYSIIIYLSLARVK